MTDHAGPLRYDHLFLFWFYKNQNVRQNRSSGAKAKHCVTSTGRRHNLVPGLHLYRQGPAWSVIYGNFDMFTIFPIERDKKKNVF